MPVGGKGRPRIRQTRQSKPLPYLYPVRNRRHVYPGGNSKASGGGVCFRIRKRQVIIPGQLAGGKV